MNEMEMRNGYGYSADRALREEIMSRGDRLFMMGTSRPAGGSFEHLFSALFSGRKFRG